ncbi:envelope stress response membrane protein PspC [Erwinia sorbitola]|uniref:Envelope stress response membrane protein PspC n=1 Tax=Erwinia sorbitola TaxID=2681984 RepID=A0ABW9R716_9GAMM|nr:envelope stress response membrane protein PspC [Erwinia sorbitola]MTD25808.1 envelope stress response membrane protein PspC [Erwinia sorbitola]
MIQKKLYCIPQQGKLKGVCAGIAEYLGVPVLLVRVIVVMSLFFGLFVLTIVGYFLLAAILPDMPPGEQDRDKPLSAHQLLDELSAELKGGERELREVERYVTSETFSVRSRFRQL